MMKRLALLALLALALAPALAYAQPSLEALPPLVTPGTQLAVRGHAPTAQARLELWGSRGLMAAWNITTGPDGGFQATVNTSGLPLDTYRIRLLAEGETWASFTLSRLNESQRAQVLGDMAQRAREAVEAFILRAGVEEAPAEYESALEALEEAQTLLEGGEWGEAAHRFQEAQRLLGEALAALEEEPEELEEALEEAAARGWALRLLSHLGAMERVQDALEEEGFGGGGPGLEEARRAVGLALEQLEEGNQSSAVEALSLVYEKLGDIQEAQAAHREEVSRMLARRYTERLEARLAALGQVVGNLSDGRMEEIRALLEEGRVGEAVWRLRAMEKESRGLRSALRDRVLAGELSKLDERVGRGEAPDPSELARLRERFKKALGNGSRHMSRDKSQ